MNAQETAALIVRDVAETDPADPHHKDTICINADVLEAMIVERLGPAATDEEVTHDWPAYIAGMVETYLRSNSASQVREAAITGIIERRMWCAPKTATSDGALYHDALQRIGTALGLPAGCDLTKACVPAIEALRESLSAPGSNGRPVLPPMTKALRDLLGTPVHTMIPLVRCLQAAGLDIPRSYEGEQAGLMYWMLGFYFEHGDDWKPHAGVELTRLQEAIRATQPAGEGAP